MLSMRTSGAIPRQSMSSNAYDHTSQQFLFNVNDGVETSPSTPEMTTSWDKR